MRLIIQALIATAMLANQVIATVQIPFTATAEAAKDDAVVQKPITLTFDPQATSVLGPQSKKSIFYTDVVVPLKTAQAAKEAADAQKAQEAANQAAAIKLAAARKSIAQTQTVALTGSDAEYKLYIYNHESGNNPTRRNGSGCIGLGQACPGSKLLAVCPTLDYACEDAFFTNYAIRRYGGWAGAYSFWIAHRWW